MVATLGVTTGGQRGRAYSSPIPQWVMIVPVDEAVSPRTEEPPPRSGLVWSTWPQALRLLATGRTARPALPVALVVGTLLSAVNQTGAIMGGRLDAATLARVLANFAIPYLVSSIGLLSAHRSPSRRSR
jgi:hypothetical protein